MPDRREQIELMNIFPDGVRFVLIDQTDRVFDFAEILTRINAHQSSGRTIFFTGISLLFRIRRIESRVLTKIAFDRQKIFRFGYGRRKCDLIKRKDGKNFIKNALWKFIVRLDFGAESS